nr:hypothetical protein [uncultured Campylobacter sp.]
MNELLDKAKKLIASNPQEALNLFNKVLASKNDDIRALTGIAQLLLNDRQNQKAIEFASKAIVTNAPLSLEIIRAKSDSYGVLAIANEREKNIHDAALRLAAHQVLADICAKPEQHIIDQNPYFKGESFGAYSPNAAYAPQFLEHGVTSYESDKEPFYALACVLVAFYHAGIKAVAVTDDTAVKATDENSKIPSGNSKIPSENSKIPYTLPQNPNPSIQKLYSNAMIFLALLAFDMDNKEKAKTLIEIAGNISEQDPQYQAIKYRVLSALALVDNNLQKADELAQKAGIFPNYKNHLVLANIAVSKDDLSAAKNEISKAKKLAQNKHQNAEITSLEAYINLKENKKDEAVKLAKTALEINKRLKAAIMVLLSIENEPDKKLDIMALMLNIHPYQKKFYNSIITTTTMLSANVINMSEAEKERQKNSANEMFKSQKFNLAVDAALSLLYFYPDDAKATMALTSSFINNADTNTAIDFYSRAAMIDSVKADALKKLSTVFFKQNEYLKAFNALEVLVNEDKADADTYKMQAEIAIKTGGDKSLKTASELIEKIKKLESKDTDIHLLNAKILEKKGKYFDAIDELNIVLKNEPNNEAALSVLAGCYNNTNQYEKWSECRNKLIELRRQKIIDDLKKLTGKKDIDINDKEFLLLEDEDQISSMLWTLHYIEGRNEKENYKLAKRYGDIVAAKTRFSYDSWGCERFGINNIFGENSKNSLLNQNYNLATQPITANLEYCNKFRDYLRKQGKKLRIGFTSGDLRSHPVGYVLEGALKLIDKDIFELYAYVTQNGEDALTARIKPHFTSWQSIAGISPAAIAARIQGDAINVLLDLSGHTSYNALSAYAYKPAPVSATYLGASFTTGLSTIDYIVGDPILTPASEQEVVSERIFNMPRWWNFTMPPDINSNELLAIDPTPPHQRNGYFTFGSFNNIYKMNDSVVALWAKILLAVPNSKLFLNYRQLTDKSQKDRIREWFARFGVKSEQLILEFTTPRYKTLNTYNEIDLALDPFPWPGGTTSTEAMMMGTPVLGLKGNSFLTRLGQSILTHANMSEFIANDIDEYFTKAVYFATDGREKLAEFRANAREHIQPLFDSATFAKDMENMFLQMWINYELGIKLR